MKFFDRRKAVNSGSEPAAPAARTSEALESRTQPFEPYPWPADERESEPDEPSRQDTLADPSRGTSESGRRGLIEACIEVSEQLDSEMLREILLDALLEAGVVADEPTGERFDPHEHQAVGRMSTDDPALDGYIGATQRPGYRDGDDIVRHAEVVVWRHERGAGRD